MTDDWTRRAACTGTDPDRWHSDDPHLTDQATAICRHCPVARNCLASALLAEGGAKPNRRYGIAGALGPKERYAVYCELQSTGRLHLLDRWASVRDLNAVVRRARVLCEEHDLTAAAAARRLGVSEKRVQRWRQSGWGAAA